jgi:hypothetical protein
MKEELATVRSLTKEEIKWAAVLSLHTYEGATADEWQDQADTLRKGDGGDAASNEDANPRGFEGDCVSCLQAITRLNSFSETSFSPHERADRVETLEFHSHQLSVRTNVRIRNPCTFSAWWFSSAGLRTGRLLLPSGAPGPE